MAQKKIEKSLGGMMDAELVDKFINQVDQRGAKIKKSLAAAIKLWVTLPEEVQARLLNQSIDANYFLETVREIVDKRIEAGRKTARKLLGRQNKKPGRKG